MKLYSFLEIHMKSLHNYQLSHVKNHKKNRLGLFVSVPRCPAWWLFCHLHSASHCCNEERTVSYSILQRKRDDLFLFLIFLLTESSLLGIVPGELWGQNLLLWQGVVKDLGGFFPGSWGFHP